MGDVSGLLATVQANQEPPAGPPRSKPRMISSLPMSGFWQSSGLAPPPLRFCLPARQQVSLLAVAGGTVSPFITGDPHARHRREKNALFHGFLEGPIFQTRDSQMYASSKRRSLTTLSRCRVCRNKWRLTFFCSMELNAAFSLGDIQLNFPLMS